MNECRVIRGLSVILALLVFASAGLGLFDSNGGSPRPVRNICGETVQLFGDGIYANDTMLKATTSKGTDEDGKATGTAVFTIVSGCIVLVWLMSILPSVFSGSPPDIIGVYTAEPTFILDIGLVLPPWSSALPPPL